MPHYIYVGVPWFEFDAAMLVRSLSMRTKQAFASTPYGPSIMEKKCIAQPWKLVKASAFKAKAAFRIVP
jgi:hypothetical protein